MRQFFGWMGKIIPILSLVFAVFVYVQARTNTHELKLRLSDTQAQLNATRNNTDGALQGIQVIQQTLKEKDGKAGSGSSGTKLAVTNEGKRPRHESSDAKRQMTIISHETKKIEKQLQDTLRVIGKPVPSTKKEKNGQEDMTGKWVRLYQKPLTWSRAREFAENESMKGHGAWSLPTLRQFQNLASSETAAIELEHDYYWTGDESGNVAIAFNPHVNRHQEMSKTSSNFVVYIVK